MSAYSTDLPSGGEHVGEVDESRIRGTFGNFDMCEMCLRYSEVLSLPAGHRAVELGEAEQCCGPFPDRGPASSRTVCRGSNRT